MKTLLQATRKPVDLDLKVIEGDLPKDISGYMFVNSACGTVNSDGLPVPKFMSKEDEAKDKINPDYGAAMLNGDSKILRFDFDEAKNGQVKFKSRLLYTPDLYADMATGKGGPAERIHKYRKFKFLNSGFGRINMKLGGRNQLNTAIIPFQHEGEEITRLYATVDAGRPYEFDPIDLKLKQPVGWMKDWARTMPRAMYKPLPTLFTNAHPVYDPENKEFFVMNFSKSMKTLLGTMHFSDIVEQHPELVRKELKAFTQEYEAAKTYEEKVKILEEMYGSMYKRVKKRMNIFRLIWVLIVDVIKLIGKLFFGLFHSEFSTEDEVHLLKWDPVNGKLKKWRVVDEEGKNIKIVQIMHQISLSKDYLVLVDCSFKFTMDQTLTYPFASDKKLTMEIDELLRNHTTVMQEPFTDVYLVKRSDLENGDTVTAKKFTLDDACLHFNADYNNEGDKVVLYTANNNANCAAEWVRPFDKLAPKNPDTEPPVDLDPDWVSFFAIGNMDVCTIGKYVLDYKSGKIDTERTKRTTLTGDMDNPNNPGPHTWGIALHTYRDIISPTVAPSNVKNIYWQNNGLYYKTLTQFIYDMYKEYSPKRVVPPQKVAELGWEVLNPVIVRTETDNMEVKDYFTFGKTDYMRSIQFINRSTPKEGVDPSMDGYIVMTMVVENLLGGVDDGHAGHIKQDKYSAEVWIFDAANLAQGPICKLSHPDLAFGFPLHSTWLAEIQSTPETYNINVREDYDHMIDHTVVWPWKRRKIKRFFHDYVYPHFE
ncbi:MAG: carotenoid oxygenase family protein [Bacteroidota bacterium]